MNPIVDAWLAIKAWYLRQYIAAIERKCGHWTRDYREALWALLRTERAIAARNNCRTAAN